MFVLEVLWFENFDIDRIFTPVNVSRLNELLIETKNNDDKRRFLVEGFKNGFASKFQGNRQVKRTAPNLKLRVGSKFELWNKVMNEVKEKRYAGPYDKVPFEYFIQSPIRLVSKDQGKKMRLIFHLSYPRYNDMPVNAGIPYEYCKVQYPDFTEAVKMCMQLDSDTIFVGKSDMSIAFRHVPLKVKDFKLIILKASHPITNKTYWFVEKCLPFSSSISCAIFQAGSDGITHIVEYQMNKPNLNYLDDHLFCEVMKILCDEQVNQLLLVCDQIKFPVSLEKTYWGTQLLVFLGYLLDTVNRRVGIPTLSMIKEFLCSKKTIVRKVQKLCGFLNFLCRAIPPGRAFTRHLYSMYVTKNSQVLKPHHHVRVKKDNKLDLKVWETFLTNTQIFTRKFIDFMDPTFVSVRMYSDASRNFQ